MSSPSYTPVISEKTAALTDQHQTYAFRVPLSATKPEIANKIKRQFDVAVKRVRVVNQSGKATNSLVGRGRRRIPGQRSDTKKAYITLAAGASLNFDHPETIASDKSKRSKEKRRG